MFHEFLEVEISDFILVGDLEESLEFGMGIILRPLSDAWVVFLDVRSNHFGNIGSAILVSAATPRNSASSGEIAAGFTK